MDNQRMTQEPDSALAAWRTDASESGATARSSLAENTATQLQPSGRMMGPGEEGRTRQILELQTTAGNQAVQKLVQGALDGEKGTAPTDGSATAADPALAVGGTRSPAEDESKRPRTLSELNLSQEGLQFVAEYEDFRAEIYPDAAQHATIGYGHKIHDGPANGQEPEEFRRGISQQRGLELLESDTRDAVGALKSMVKVPLTQAQFDALTSLVFNIGAGQFRSSTLLRELNAGNLEKVAEEFAKWTHAGGKSQRGLKARRDAEIRLFVEGEY